ncbi:MULTISPECIES: hypothetical protein [unclassified Endozoicomonas]|uniref:hypothetical protein n=1 Tax=unclassified Endozoicomonas TaxID=2644528 RepID=UPI003BB62A51
MQASVDIHTVRTERSRSAVLPSFDSAQEERGVRVLVCINLQTGLFSPGVLLLSLLFLSAVKATAPHLHHFAEYLHRIDHLLLIYLVIN